ncbi:MAG: GNAT family N-acetyltransferase [Eubacterium sp.]|nr:GNAT family N-acetyltransferase [Eubacterium sp.]
MRQILLRQWKQADAKALAQAADNPHIAENLRNVFPHPYTLEDAQWFINDCIANAGDGQLLRAVEVDGTVAGSISISRGTDVYEKSAELGYWLAEGYWRQGIMTQAVRMICEEAFGTMDIARIFAEPFAHNAGSRRVLEKAGFTCEGTMRDSVYKNGKIGSYCMYALLREEAQQ